MAKKTDELEEPIEQPQELSDELEHDEPEEQKLEEPIEPKTTTRKRRKSDAGLFRVKANTLDVYVLPKPTADIVGTLSKGQTIKLEAMIALADDGTTWRSYIGPTGARRYVDADGLEMAD